LVGERLLNNELLFAGGGGLALHETHVVLHHHGATADEHGHHFELAGSGVAEGPRELGLESLGERHADLKSEALILHKHGQHFNGAI